ncbi:hypothetical protein HPB50_006490 [Hyalomma asiaticum]|uniref:Uncharacterized protein n=1 Tax=Hyalomma asiaticum TaxID=266040 RepID=A0ACB7SFK4_HYAAI|nr:hypothetical protein HPB50_006490 [Hyalomma asiaticum]
MAAAPAAAGRLRLASNHVSAAGGAVGRGPIRPMAARAPPPPPLRAPSDSSDEDYRECCCLTQCLRTCNAKQVRAPAVCTPSALFVCPAPVAGRALPYPLPECRCCTVFVRYTASRIVRAFHVLVLRCFPCTSGCGFATAPPVCLPICFARLRL